MISIKPENIHRLKTRGNLIRFFHDHLAYRVDLIPRDDVLRDLPRKAQELTRSMHQFCDYRSDGQQFCVFHIELNAERFRRTDFRTVLEPFYRRYPGGDYLFVFTLRGPYEQLAFASPRRILDPRNPDKVRLHLRTLTVEREYPYRTDLEILSAIHTQGEEEPGRIWQKHLEAFDVERVTKRFFEDYRLVFADLQKRLYEKSKDLTWAHDYALQLLNRIMFLYFIQRKGWLGGNPRFLRHFWRAYKDLGQPQNSFFKNWLSVLFFEAFNENFQAGRSEYHHRFRDDIRTALAEAPYLNGGLFTPNELDDRYDVTIEDAFFETLFDNFKDTPPGFLERYNFTISENTPLDQEVAVDPEMIGKIYESLVNITFEGLSEEDLRGTAGIFYTPRVEIDLMCRLALVDRLTNHLSEKHKSLLYEWVFAYNAEEKDEVDERITKEGLWEKLNGLLRSLTILDPACGSGSFLIGMLLILDDLQQCIDRILGSGETPYERRRRIIRENLYGVDVLPWAVHVAELRLWLQLVVETELQHWELKARPLLPNLSFKIRPGDSLVQEIGGINLSLHRAHLDIPVHLKGRLTQLKGKKWHFYNGEMKGLSEKLLKQEEFRLFKDILFAKHHTLQKEIKRLTRWIETPQPKQLALEGIKKRKPEQLNLQVEQWKRELEEKEGDLARIRQALEALRSAEDVPFVWDIAFVEVFESEKKGFDIVIGNPPYVRQERIADPTKKPEDYGGKASERWRHLKAEYKQKLQRSVWLAYPHFFGYKSDKPEGSKNPLRKLDGKSDYYIYFYLHGLSLLNEKGSFCFITSNSWLDVGFGKDLQEFLLRYSHIKMILDNQAKRSFEADINTVIVLLAPPVAGKGRALLPKKTARFVAFKRPFEEVMHPVIFEEIEETTDITGRPEFRCIAKSQEELYREGLEIPEGEKETLIAKKARYIGNKWGGKYLRAPDIFFTILEKGKGKLVRLGDRDIAEVRFGIKTGANEFFYLEPTGQPAPVEAQRAAPLLHVRNGAGWEGYLEEEFLKPIIKSPREIKTILVCPEDLRYRVFMCHKSKGELRRDGQTHTLAYIEWGEKQGYHRRPTCRSRSRWWDLGIRHAPPIVSPSSVTDLYRAFDNAASVLIDKRLYEIYCSDDKTRLVTALNSTVSTLFLELGSRTGLGQGLLDLTVYEVADCYIISPSLISEQPPHIDRRIKSLFEELGLPKPNRDYSNIHPEDVSLDKVLPDRRALDEVVFEALGLTEKEQLEVYRAVVELVKARLVKARSV